MRLGPFIRENEQPIIKNWESFARTLVPASDDMTPRSLRDHIKEILAFIADDIASSQTDSEQTAKSEGKKPKLFKDSAAEIHACLRQSGGFRMDQVVSEFRALRASVIRLWEAQLADPTKADISDLTRFNESIDQAATETISYFTKAIDHSRDLFLAVLGHDLRNPIGAMKTSAQLALHIGPLNAQQTMLATQIITSAGRATEIIDHLLDLTRARLGSGLEVVKKPMDMAFVGRQLVDEMRALHPGRTFQLDISGDTEGSWDKARIGQVFSNVLGNAIQYGFKDLPIGVAVRGDSDAVVVSVHDDGVPIPATAMGSIFESLTRGGGGKSSNDHESTNLGLGLYITKQIVLAHGGTVRATSSERNGTTFTATFPR